MQLAGVKLYIQEVVFGSIFLLFPIRVAVAHAHSSHGKSLAPSSYSDSPVKFAWRICSDNNNNSNSSRQGMINPLSLMSDQHQISPCNINAL